MLKMLLYDLGWILLNINWGTNIKRWFVDQASAIAIVVLILALIPLIFRRQWINLLGTLVVGALAIYFITYPDVLISIGRSIYRIISGTAAG